MNANEPVAWISVLGVDLIGQKFTDVRVSLTKTDVASIPLYTHSVKELDEQFEKGFKAGKEEGWKAHKFYHPVKEQDESFDRTASHMAGEYVSHPVKEQDTDCQYCKQGCIRCDARKQLTDEEIEEVFYSLDVGHNSTDFARAILRKAQEK
jgi:hypothetical protein